MSVLQLKGIAKRYGPVTALEGLDMTVHEGVVYGFLGRNGAGKSTALQIIMGISLATRGETWLFDERVRNDDPNPRRAIGYVAQEQHFYDWMTATRIGKFVSGFYPAWDDPEYRRLLKLFDIPADRKIVGLSTGMKAKLALALALAHRPRLLLLDEPTAGMDPVSRREFIDMVRDQAVRSQRTTLFSSHYIEEVEQAATHLGIIDGGVMRYEGSLETLRNTVLRMVLPQDFTEISVPPLARSQVLQSRLIDGQTELILRLPDDITAEERNDLSLYALHGRLDALSLEDIFIAMVTRRVAI